MTFAARGSCVLNGAWFTRIQVPFPLAQDSDRSSVSCNMSCLSYVVCQDELLHAVPVSLLPFVRFFCPSFPPSCFLSQACVSAVFSSAHSLRCPTVPMSIIHSSAELLNVRATLRSSCSVLLGSSVPGSSLRDALLLWLTHRFELFWRADLQTVYNTARVSDSRNTLC